MGKQSQLRTRLVQVSSSSFRLGSKSGWSLTKNCGSKIVETQKLQVPKNIGSQKFGVMNHEKFQVMKNFGSREIVGPQKFVGLRKILGPKKFWVMKNFGS